MRNDSTKGDGKFTESMNTDAKSCDMKKRKKRRRPAKIKDDQRIKIQGNAGYDYANAKKSEFIKQKPNIITDGSRDNDPKWYMNLDQIARDYATLPFSNVLGLNSTIERPNMGIVFNNPVECVSGLMTIDFIPTIGSMDEGPVAPVNIAAQQIYTLVRSANSGRVNYDKTDLIMLIMAMDSAYILYEDLLRAYRVLSTFNSVNRYYPIAILNALGFDQSLQWRLADFRGLLDMFAYKLASINIPDQLDVLKRHSWMSTNIYLDDENIKAQSYAFRPKWIYVWNEGVGDNPTSLKHQVLHPTSSPSATDWSSSLLDYDKISTLINTVMNPLLGSEDVGIMSGDMNKAFGEAGMIKIAPVEDYAALVPVYSSEVCLQIRNIFSSCAPVTSTPSASGDITQVLSNPVTGPYITQNLGYSSAASDYGLRKACRPILNFIDEDTSPENVMVATRLMSLDGQAGSGGISSVVTYGTEVVTNMQIWTMNTIANPTLIADNFDQDWSAQNGNTIGAAISTGMALTRKISMFHNAPANYMFTYDRDSTSGVVSNILWCGSTHNMCNYVYLEDEMLKNIHRSAVMSLFTVKDYKLR